MKIQKFWYFLETLFFAGLKLFYDLLDLIISISFQTAAAAKRALALDGADM